MKKLTLVSIIAFGCMVYYARWFLLTVIILLSAIFLQGCASAPEPAFRCAVTGQAMDTISTGAGLAQGFTEANPLGAGVALAVKPALIYWADSQPEPDRTENLRVVGAMGYGAAAHNLCILAGGTFPACFLLVGIPTMFVSHKYTCD